MVPTAAHAQTAVATVHHAGNGVVARTVSAESEAEKEKKRIARKKERRATLILGLIMGSFIACWFPFFFLYSISPVCPVCEEVPDSPCCVQAWGFSFAFWLGYSNSALNPVIYTIFNKDFRRAFKRILFK
jgi:MFS family permease